MKGKKGTGIPDIIQFKRLLHDRGLKATPQRTAVHEAMLDLVHAGADDVAAWIAARGGVRISPASVYNILTLFADLGLYGRRSGRSGKMVFDARTGAHLHLYDTQGGTWRDLEDDALMEWLEAHFKGRRFRGYKIDGFEVQLLCHPTRRGTGRKA